MLQPHQASATHETREAMGRLVLDNLAAQFAGRRVADGRGLMIRSQTRGGRGIVSSRGRKERLVFANGKE